MSNPAEELAVFTREKEFFIGIDSDGCVFDTMELKHKECFCPAFINHLNLQAVSKYARETWEFVNLYSRTRGINRFLGVLHTLDLLARRQEVSDRKVKIPEMNALRNWAEREPKLGNPALKKEITETGDPDLKTLYEWSMDVNQAVAKIVRNMSPFPFVKESLERIKTEADAIVISQAPKEALNREWSESSITEYVKLIAGQEMGTKTEHIKYTAAGKYESSKTLMIGDAPGDLKAAKNNNALFFPIIPGQEEKSWETLYNEGLDRFFSGSFAGEYEERIIDKFFKNLPENPPWQK